jgi:hypothetical protein
MPRKIKPITWVYVLLLALAPCLSSAASLVVVYVPGYSYGSFVTTTAVGVEDIELDSSGNVYQCASGDIRRITPEGAISPWSSAIASSLGFSSGDMAYGAGRALCHCINAISPDGSFVPVHTDSLEWSYMAASPDSVYSNVSGGQGEGVYRIDRATGVPTSLANGGPGAGGSGINFAMQVGQDGKLYETGYDGALVGVFRLDGSRFTLVGTWPNGGLGLAQDNQGIFYTSVTIVPQFGPSSHQVWMFDPNTGDATLLAEGTGGSHAVAYDRARNILYVQNGPSIYIIRKSPTPVRHVTWAHIKESYR